MPHQCTRCSKIYPDASAEILHGCSCGSRFFYYIKEEKLEQLKKEARQALEELDKADKIQIEKDIRELTGMEDEPDKPVILDLESVRVLKPGKFEIDIVNLFNKRRPLIYKLEEGKYIIDLASSLKVDDKLVKQKIRDPDKVQLIEEEEENDEGEEEDEHLKKEDTEDKDKKERNSEEEIE